MKTGFINSITAAFALFLSVPVALAGNWQNFSNFNKVTDIAVRNTEVWASAKGGLVRYDKASGIKTFFNKGFNELPSLSVERVIVSKLTGDIWIGTYDNGLARYDGTAWTHFPFPVTAMLYEMKMAADGAIWCATSRGLYKFSGNQFTGYLLNGSSSAAAAWDIDLFPDGRILCGGFQPGIFNPATNHITDISSSSFAYGSSRVLVIDSSHFAFATDHGELSLFADTTETDTFHFQSLADDMQLRNGKLIVSVPDFNQLLEKSAAGWDSIPLQGKTINAFRVATDGSLWIGSPDDFGMLIHRTAPSAAEEINIRHCGLSENHIGRIRGTSSGDLLLAHSQSIQRYSPATNIFSELWATPNALGGINDVIEINDRLYVSTYNAYLYEYTTQAGWRQIGSADLPKSEVDELAGDGDGNLWVCGPGYFAKYDGTAFTVYDNSTDTVIHVNEYIRDIHYDTTRNILWVASYKGIYKLENGVVSLMNDNNIPGIQYYDAIETIEEDAQHNIWFGTVYGALLKYDGTAYSITMLPRTAGNQFVTDIKFDGSTMYISDNLYSIWKYKNGLWDSINRFNSPLADEFITSMYVDRQHNLWMSNITYGMDVYNGSGLALSAGSISGAVAVSAYPNPAVALVTFLLNSTAVVSIEVVNFDGRVVEQFSTASHNPVLDMSAYAKGIYLVRLRSGEDVSYAKIMKQ
jgi:ligand-binding sensor domain-containing protein